MIIGLLLSAFFLWLAFRRVDFKEIWVTIKTINFWWFIPFIVVTMVSFYTRAIRWRYLFLPRYTLSTRRLFPPLIIGFAFNGIFPARAGEFARAYLGARRENIRFSTMFATIVVERIFDGLTIFALFALGLFFLPPFDPGISVEWDNRTTLTGAFLIRTLSIVLPLFIVLFIVLFKYTYALQKRLLNPSQRYPTNIFIGVLKIIGAARYPRTVRGVFIVSLILGIGLLTLNLTGSLIPEDLVIQWGKLYTINGETLQTISKRTSVVLVFLLLFLICLLINRTRKIIQRTLLRMPLLPVRLKEGFNHILEKFAEGLGALQSGRALVMVVFYSFIVWLLVGVSLQLMSFGFENVTMNFWQAMLIVIIVCVTISIPAAPGYWGLYEFGCVLAMLLLGVQQQREVSLGFSLIIHAGQQFPIIAIGLFYFIRENVSYEALTHEMEDGSSVEA